jgi:voltage-gated potassium channel
MITGYAIIAVPTGIFAVELSEATRRRDSGRSCPSCAAEGHTDAASFCWRCGHHLIQRIVLPGQGESPP